MADTNAAPDEKYNDDGTENPDYIEPKDESKSADDTKNTDNPDKDGDDADFDDTVDPTKPPAIPVRNSNLQHIIARKNEKIKKLESRSTDEDEGDGSDDADTNLTEDAERAIETKVQKAIAPLMSKLATDADKAEFEQLLKDEPEAAKYANHIKAYMEHDAYKNVSPVVIFHHLAFESAKAIGAKKKSVADFDARSKRGGGRNLMPDKGNLGNLPSSEDIANMSDADFEKLDQQVLQGKFLNK